MEARCTSQPLKHRSAGMKLLRLFILLPVIPQITGVALASSSNSSLPVMLSTDASGMQADSTSGSNSFSANGRYVVFASIASNLVPGDDNYCVRRSGSSNCVDVFLKDIQTEAITRVSTDSSGNQANGDSDSPSISADGRFISFSSGASNLIAGDTNNDYDVFVKDTQTGITMRVSTDSAGNQGGDSNTYWFGGTSLSSSISADGRYVAFNAAHSNLVPNDSNFNCHDWHGLANHCSDVYVKDSLLGTTTRISTDSAGNQANAASWAPSISADGRYVAYNSSASNLVSDDLSAKNDIFVKDMQSGVTTCVSTSSLDEEADDHSNSPAVSSDGRYIAFDSRSSNLVEGDFNQCNEDIFIVNCGDIFLKNTLTGETVLASSDAAGNQANGESDFPSMSGDGRFVSFNSSATNLTRGDTNGWTDVFVKDMQTGIINRVSTGASDNQGSWTSSFSSISEDGRYVVFVTAASDLVPGDTNNQRDIILAYADMSNSYWSWYDGQSPGARNWVLMANAGGSPRNLGFGVEIAGQHMDISPLALASPDCIGGQCAPGEVPLGSVIAPVLPGVIGGAVRARVGDDGAGMLTSQRVLWGDSLEEVLGTPEERLSDHYYWPWYDSLSPGFTNWVVVANPGYSPVYYQIKIDGQVMGSGSILPGDHVAPTFPGVMTGPVEVQAWSDQVGGSSPAKAIASQRVLSDYGKAFNEEPGIPAAELSITTSGPGTTH